MSQTKKIAVFILVSCYAAAAAFAGPRSESELRRELEEIQRRIKHERDRVQKTDRKKQDALNELEKTEAELNACERELADIKARQRNIQKEMSRLEKQIQEQENALRQQQSYLEERLRVRYCFGELGSFKVMLSSNSIADLAKREKFLNILFRRDRETMEKFRASIAALEESRDELKNKQESLSEILLAKGWLEAKLIQDRGIKQELIRKLNQEKNVHLQMLAGLDEAQAKLEKMLQELSDSSFVAETSFHLFKGNLCFPVKGAVEEVFGEKENPRFHTVTFHKGIDLRAKDRTPIRSIYSGKVLFADWFRGYGNLMILDHGGGYYSLYAHANSFTKNLGDEVSRNEIIGRVGETGSIKGPYLYFELRHHGKPLDPMEWLNKECQLNMEN